MQRESIIEEIEEETDSSKQFNEEVVIDSTGNPKVVNKK